MEKQKSGLGRIISLFFINLFWNGISFTMFIAFFRELLRGNLIAVFILMFITIFVAVGISQLLIPFILEVLSLIGIWRPEAIGASQPSQPAMAKKEQIDKESNNTFPTMKLPASFPPLSVWIIAIYLILAGFLISTKQMPMVIQWFSIRSWQETPCLIISRKVITSDIRGKSLYTIEIAYQYTYADKTYISHQYSRVNDSSESWRQFERIAKKYPAGTTAKCYVNPANPGDAVISRDIRGTQFGIGGLAGLILLICALVMRYGSVNQWYGIKKMLNLNPAVATRFGAWIIAALGWIVFGGGMVLGDVSEMESLGKPATPTVGITIFFIIGCLLILWRLLYTIRLARAGQITPPSPFSKRRINQFWPTSKQKSQAYLQPQDSETVEDQESDESDEEEGYPIPALQPTMWNYTAIDHEGRKINSTISATDWIDAIENVHRRNLKPIKFFPSKEYKEAIKKIPYGFFTIVNNEGRRFQGELPSSALDSIEKLNEFGYQTFTMGSTKNLDISSDDTALDKFGKAFSKILLLPMIGASFIFMMTFIDYFRAVNLTANNTRETIGTVLDINEESGNITYNITINGKTYERLVYLNKERIKELKEGSQIPIVYSAKYPFLFKLKSKNPSNNIPDKNVMLISGLILIGSAVLMITLSCYHYIYRILKAAFAKEPIPGDDVKRLLSNLLSTILFPLIFMTVSLSMSAQYKTSFLHPFELWIILLIVVEAGLAFLLYRKQPFFFD
jgi:hypothetical protein